MFSRFRPPSDKIELVPWRRDEAELISVGGVSSLERTDLVVATGAIPASVVQRAPEITPIIYLPTVASSHAWESIETVRHLAERAATRSEHVAWVYEADVADPFAVPAAAEFPMKSRLAGDWVLVTRPRHQVAETVERLRSLGATVVSEPAIVIGPPSDWGPVDAALDRLEDYDWLVFSSTNGVRFLLDRLRDRQGDVRRLGSLKLAAIGPGTADALGTYQLQADLVPVEYRAESLAEALIPEAAGKRFLLARASRGREILAERLVAAGAQVDQTVVYRSEDLAVDEPRLCPVVELFEQERIDWVTVTSSAIARSLVGLFGARLGKARLASISPLTSKMLCDLGHRPAVEARRYTMEGVVEAMLAEREGP